MASAIEIQEAFRRGARGVSLVAADAGGLAEEAGAFASGANEAALLGLTRLAGLTDAHAAYETGRALRCILQLFDRAGAPERVGRQFIDNLAGAVVIERMRGGTRPWAAADTVDMFVEMYARVLGNAAGDIERIRGTVMDYAVGDGELGSGVRASVPWFRRLA